MLISVSHCRIRLCGEKWVKHAPVIRFVFNDLAPKTTLKEVAEAAVAAMEPAGVLAEQILHPATEISQEAPPCEPSPRRFNRLTAMCHSPPTARPATRSAGLTLQAPARWRR